MLATIFWIIVILLVLAFKDEILQILSVVLVFAGLGAIIGWLLFDSASTGAWVGVGVVVAFGLKILSDSLSGDYNGLLFNAYRLTTAPCSIPTSGSTGHCLLSYTYKAVALPFQVDPRHLLSQSRRVGWQWCLFRLQAQCGHRLCS